MGCGASKTGSSIGNNAVSVHPTKPQQVEHAAHDQRDGPQAPRHINNNNEENTTSSSIHVEENAAAEIVNKKQTPISTPAVQKKLSEKEVDVTKAEKSTLEEDPNFPSGQTTAEFREDSRLAHNKFRAMHHVGDLTLNDNLCEMAQRWADHLAANNERGHSSKESRLFRGTSAGENIYYYWSSDPRAVPTGSQAVTSWYNEIKDYDFSEQQHHTGVVGHFTAVVWRTTTEFGIARAKNQDRTVIVANYYPPGNYIGQEMMNVFHADDMKRKQDLKKKTVTDEEFRDDVLALHNKYRSDHHVGALILNADLCNVAQEWAEHLAKINERKFSPHERRRVNNEHNGENIYETFSPPDEDVKALEPVSYWYREVEDYDFSEQQKHKGITGAFTQVVWKNTSELGVGRARNSETGKVYIVVNYCPAGNYVGESTKNVLPK